jgi:transmembrane sensor
MPLKYVVARLNRYSGERIVLSDPATGELKVTGRFRLSRTDDTLAMLSALPHVDTARSDRRIDVTRRPPA